MTTNTAITVGCYCTFFFEVLGFWLFGSVFEDYSKPFALSVAPAWAPVVMIAIRSHVKRIEKLPWLDIAMMVCGFPIVFGGLAIAWRLILK